MSKLQQISVAQDKSDFETMRALMQMRREYPKSYNTLRESVAVYRADTAYKCYLKTAYNAVA